MMESHASIYSFFYSSSSLLMYLVSFLGEVWDGNKSHLAGASAIFEFEQELSLQVTVAS